ncbi:MAG: hypothetical protein COA88_02185 [Kordia sp.]|nr:MAG: hypothetical protein COA88_02185 [Kordia sp.]
MKKILFLSLSLLSIISVFSQNTKSTEDTFTYKEIKITNKEEGVIQLSGAKTTKKVTTASRTSSGTGETPGILSVSPSGGATYNIPIAVPSGITGIAPKISLAYDSQGGSGLAGYGWNVSGVSTVSRIPSTKFHDGQIDGINFNNMDRFALDGQRLMLKNGTYGGDGAEYETEKYSNLKITSHGVSSYGATYGPSYFTVRYPDGAIANYGTTPESNQRTNFHISNWKNPQGAGIDYEYTYDGRIHKIKYGSIGTATQINEIVFNYGRRSREDSYINNVNFQRSWILEDIQVNSNSSLYRKYNLTHNETALRHTRLTSVQETSADGVTKHSPIYFQYDDTENTITYNEKTTELGVQDISSTNSETVSLDLTGSGKTDFIVYPKNNKTKFWLFKDVQSNGYNPASEITTGAFENIFPVNIINSNNKVIPGQGIGIIQKGSGSQVKFKTYANGTTNPLYYQYQKTWNSPTYSFASSCDVSSRKNIPKTYVSGDFNGDGLTDVLAFQKSYTSKSCYERGDDCDDGGGGGGGGELDPLITKANQRPEWPGDDDDGGLGGGGNDCTCYCGAYTIQGGKAYFIDLNKNITTNFVNVAGALQDSLGATDKIMTADFNGDGKTDIMHVTDGKLSVYSLDNNNHLQLLWEKNSSSIHVDRPFLLGDYNGDGKTDFLQYAITTTNPTHAFYTFISTGADFKFSFKTMPFSRGETVWNGYTGWLYSSNLIPLDVNGDGKTDIIDYQTSTSNSHTNGTQIVKVYYNEGIKETPGGIHSYSNTSFVYGGSALKTGNLKHFSIPIFLNSEQPNKKLSFASISNKWVTSFNFNNDHKENMLIRSVENNGLTYTIDYKPLDPSLQISSNNPNQFYKPIYNTEVYPNVGVINAPTTKVVSMLQRTAEGAVPLKKQYMYHGAVFNNAGLGFIGFNGIAQTNWHSGLSDIRYSVAKYDTNLRGALVAEYSQNGYFSFNIPSSNYVFKTTNTYSSSISSNKVFKLSLTSSLTQNTLAGYNTNTTYLYDNYNNPTKISTNYFGPGTNVVDINYDNSTGSNYYIGRPNSKTVTSTIGSETFSSEEQYVYSGYSLTQKKTKGNGTPFNTEAFEYDNFGNVIRRITTPSGSVSRQVQFEYDPSGRYLTKTIDVEGLETTYQYNTTLGILVNDTNQFNQATGYEYDSWNRPIKVTDYLGNESETSYAEASNHAYTIIDTGNDGSRIETYTDNLKRVTSVKEKDVLGQMIGTDVMYDKFDRPYKVSEPYSGSSPSQWNETKYDVYGRVIKQILNSGKEITISYSGLTTSVNDGVKTVTTVKDAMGNVVSVTDPGGTINYSYYGNGGLKSTNYEGVIVTTEQDGWGRKTKLTDPSAGVFEYTYNGFNELTSEINPKGETSYTYSAIGKLNEKSISGDNANMTMQYTYDPNHKFLSGITLNGGEGTYGYTYDSNARLTGISETNTFAEFSKEYTYDSFGRIATEEYKAKLLANNKESTKKINLGYQYGELKTMLDTATSENLWTIDAVNARGQVTVATMGNELREKNQYDSFGYLQEHIIEKGATSTPAEIMKLTTSFNAERGTLNSRTNSLFSWSETFGYDNLDRLVSFNDNNGDNSHAYDTKGRITNNNTIGDYNYTGASYQVDSIDLNTQGDLYYQQNELQQVTYNAFKKPFEINEDGKEKIGFQYNAFNRRSHMFYGDTNTDILLRNNRKHYSNDGSMEISYDLAAEKTIFTTYIGGDAYGTNAIWRSEQYVGGTTDEEYLYLHRDYLGSILMISDKDGTVKEKRHFDAWGNTVKLTDGNGNALDKFVYSDRGYTGHEHLQGVNLVHMNGRLYDPKLKRFLSTDNYIQDITNTQNFNRYGYVLNNPLRYTDPTGEQWENGVETEDPTYNYQNSLDGAQSIDLNINVSFSSFGDWVGNNGKSFGNLFTDLYDSWFGKADRGPVNYGRTTNLNQDPLAGYIAPPLPSFFGAGGMNSGLGITSADVLDTALDFIPIVGGVKDIYKGIRDGDGWGVALGVASIAADVFTLGSASLVKGAIKTGIKAGTRVYAKGLAKRALKGACFVAGTLVKAAEGNKAIETIKEGDEVWAYNERTKENELRKVVRTFVREKEAIYVLNIGNTTIETTDEHPFYINNTWVPAKNLEAGDVVTLLSGKKAPINTIKIVQRTAKVYNFEVEGLHTYFVSDLGVLVHNTCNLVKGQLDRMASDILLTKPNTKTWNKIVKQVGNADFMKKGTKFQTRVGSKADADALLKEMMGGNLNRYKNHARYNTKYKKGYEVHQQGLEGGFHDLFHIKWYNGNATGHIFY